MFAIRALLLLLSLCCACGPRVQLGEPVWLGGHRFVPMEAYTLNVLGTNLRLLQLVQHSPGQEPKVVAGISSTSPGFLNLFTGLPHSQVLAAAVLGQSLAD